MGANKGLGRFGSYYLLDKLGDGGMAIVFRAVRVGQRDFRTIVALKIIRPHLNAGEHFVQYFQDEARLGQYLSHPNIVEILDFGEHHGYLFMAMEYVNGPSLALLHNLFRKRGEKLPPEIALQLMSRVCRGLDFAHKSLDHKGNPLQVVHRDVKPSNIVVGPQGQVKLCDFGVARAVGSAHQTVVASIKGTIRYMSPEQAWGHLHLDARADLFSVGLLLTELLTGRPVYPGESEMELLRRAQDANVEAALERLPDIPGREDLHELLTRCLTRDPDARHGTALALARHMERVLVHYPQRRDLNDWLAEVCVVEFPELASRWKDGMDLELGDEDAAPSLMTGGGRRPLAALPSLRRATDLEHGDSRPGMPAQKVGTAKTQGSALALLSEHPPLPEAQVDELELELGAPDLTGTESSDVSALFRRAAEEPALIHLDPSQASIVVQPEDLVPLQVQSASSSPPVTPENAEDPGVMARTQRILPRKVDVEMLVETSDATSAGIVYRPVGAREVLERSQVAHEPGAVVPASVPEDPPTITANLAVPRTLISTLESLPGADQEAQALDLPAWQREDILPEALEAFDRLGPDPWLKDSLRAEQQAEQTDESGTEVEKEAEAKVSPAPAPAVVPSPEESPEPARIETLSPGLAKASPGQSAKQSESRQPRLLLVLPALALLVGGLWWSNRAPDPGQPVPLSRAAPPVERLAQPVAASMQNIPEPVPTPTPAPVSTPGSSPTPQPISTSRTSEKPPLIPLPAKKPETVPVGTARLSLNARPVAIVRVGGQKLGSTPLYEVSVQARSQTVTFTFEAGKQLSRTIKLEPDARWSCVASLADAVVRCEEER